MSAFVLKLIAVICMGIDHAGHVFSYSTPEYFRWIGRISMPIYVYLISEGCVYTKNINKYMLRLGLFALISQIPYAVAFTTHTSSFQDAVLNISFVSDTNVFYTLFLGVVCVVIFEKLKSKTGDAFLSMLPALPISYLGKVLSSDYGMIGVLWIFALYLVKTKPNKLIVLLFGIYYFYGHTSLWAPNLINPYFIFALFACIIIFLYNGQRGKPFKWIFYWLYPLHLSALACILFLFPSPFVGQPIV